MEQSWLSDKGPAKCSRLYQIENWVCRWPTRTRLPDLQDGRWWVDWKTVYANTSQGDIFDLRVLDEKTVIAAVNDTFLLRSSDGGLTWQDIKLQTKGAAALAQSKDGKIWVVGRNGSFYYSSDLGLTWRRPNQFSEDLGKHDWDSVSFNDSNFGIAASGIDNILALTEDGGQSWKVIQIESINDGGFSISLQGNEGLLVGGHKVFSFRTP